MDTEENIRAEYAACGVYEDLDSSTDGDETFGFKESKLSPNKTTTSISQSSGSFSRKVSQFRDLRRHSDDLSGRASDNSLPFVEAISERPDLRARSDSIADSIGDDPQLNGASDNETEISEDGIISHRITTHVDEEVEEDDDIAKVVYQVDDIHPEVSDKRNALSVVESIQNKKIECPYNFNEGGKDETDESAYDSEEFECDGDDQEAMISSHIIASDETETSTGENVRDVSQDSEQVHEGVMTCDSTLRIHEKNKTEEGSLCEIAGHNAEDYSLHQTVEEVCDRLIPSAASMSTDGANNRITHKLSAENNGRCRGNIDKQSNNTIVKENHVSLSALSSIRHKNVTDSSIPAGNVSLYDLACNGSAQHVEGASTSYISTYPYPYPYPCPRPLSPLRDKSNSTAEASASTFSFSINKVQEMSNYRSVAHHKNSLNLNPNRNVLKEKKQGYVSRIQQQSNKETAVRLLKGRVVAAMMKKRTNVTECVQDRAINGATPHGRTNYEYDNNDHSNDSCNYNNDNTDDNDNNYKMNNKSNCKDNNSNDNKINNTKNSNKYNDKSNTNDYKDIRNDHAGGRQTYNRQFDKSNSKTIIDRSRNRGRERSRSRSRVRDGEGASRQRQNQDDNKQRSNTPQKFTPALTRSPVRTVMPAIRSSTHLSLSPVRQLRGIVAGGGVTKHPMLVPVKRSLVPVEGFQLRDLNDR